MKRYFPALLLLIFLLTTAGLRAEEEKKGWFDGEDVIWRSGNSMYFKYEPLDSDKFGNNDHPVDLEEKDIAIALESLIIWDKEYLSNEGDSTPVFSLREINRLAKFIAKGLRGARPDQDIVFLTEMTSPKLILLKKKIANAGRAFYKDGKLNLIIGTYNQSRNDAFEKVYDPGGQSKLPYQISHGSRSRTGSFDQAIVKVNGVENMKTGKTRRDWFVIDVKLASESYLAQIKAKQNPQEDSNKRLLEKQSAELAKERREMRLEMARLRKEMEQNQGGAVASNESSLEERLKTLDELKSKDLITQDEYDTKRQEILNDI